VVARVLGDRVTLSVDTSGEALHKRGWRQEVSRAPLRETLASAIVLAAAWDAASPLVDPFCGSGTIVVEAALQARDLAPGRDRGFAFQAWPDFEAGTWASVRGEVASRARPLPAGAVLAGRDRDAGAVEAARANAARAGVGDDVTFTRAALSDFDAPATGAGRAARRGWIVTNPPYGARVSSGHDLRDLYARLGDVARRHVPGWRVAILAADTRLAAQAHLRLETLLATTNGGIDVSLLAADVPELPAWPGRAAGASGEPPPAGSPGGDVPPGP
jgi:putative N6-adenine-specific DNA methylase